jgi:hypothetical protein
MRRRIPKGISGTSPRTRVTSRPTTCTPRSSSWR